MTPLKDLFRIDLAVFVIRFFLIPLLIKPTMNNLKSNKCFGKSLTPILLLSLFFDVAMAATGNAGSVPPPQQIIEETSKQLQATLQQQELRNDFAKAVGVVEKIIEPSVDFDRMAALILGKHWRAATEDQKTRFVKEYRTLIVRTYARAFTEYADWNIRYVPLKLDPADKKVIVRTRILPPGGQPLSVDFRMVHPDDQWKVYDVIIEGIGLVQSYRTSFSDEIARTGSIDSLIKRLQTRNSDALTVSVKPLSLRGWKGTTGRYRAGIEFISKAKKTRIAELCTCFCNTANGLKNKQDRSVIDRQLLTMVGGKSGRWT